jgi:RNA polymerase sigma-70 factor, ECF subfamily
MILRDIEELATEEVASLLDVTSSSVKVRLHRGRQALKVLIEREQIL